MKRRLTNIAITIVLLISPLASFSAGNQDNTSIRFLVLTDIHFDPYASCRSPKQAPCQFIKKLRTASAEEWPQLLAAAGTPVQDYQQDTNYRLMQSALAEAGQAAENKQAAFVLVLGDMISHDFRHDYKRFTQDNSRAGYEAFVRKTMTFLNNELARTFPRRDVYSLVGNNDSYHRDYYVNPHGLFYQQMASLWSSLIKSQSNSATMRREFAQSGYYAVNLPMDPKLRLLMLNTVLFSNKAKGKGIQQAADQQLDWLHQELIMARQNHQTVLIGMHIPDGIDVYTSLRIRLVRVMDLWQPEYTERFQQELGEFAPEIAGLFAGHLHANWFHMLRFEHMNDVPFIGTASVSPIYGNDPGFSIYQYSTVNGHLDDIMTYHYPLNTIGGWKMSYYSSQPPYMNHMA